MKFLIYLILFVSLGLGLFVFQKNKDLFRPLPVHESTNTATIKKEENKPTIIIAQNLDTPWEIVFLPNKNILVTERKGVVDEIDIASGNKIFTTNIEGVKEIGEGGLLGVALDPAFEINNYVYFYYTYSRNNEKTLNKVVRMKYEEKKFSNEEVLVDSIPGASNHNGGRIKFGPDGNLYVTTGDAESSPKAQDINSLSGKILRMTAEGKKVAGNPFNNLVFSFGHRNPQGLAWDRDGNLWATEHGRSGVLSGLDEINKIEIGKNYGWPDIQGNETKEGMVTAVINSGPTTTWAPAGLAFFNGSLFWGGLRGQTLYQGKIDGSSIALSEHFKGEFGRIRDVVVGPDNMLYITTSNLDGRGSPKEGDDKIIRIDPNSL